MYVVGKLLECTTREEQREDVDTLKKGGGNTYGFARRLRCERVVISVRQIVCFEHFGALLHQEARHYLEEKALQGIAPTELPVSNCQSILQTGCPSGACQTNCN